MPGERAAVTWSSFLTEPEWVLWGIIESKGHGSALLLPSGSCNVVTRLRTTEQSRFQTAVDIPTTPCNSHGVHCFGAGTLF